MIEEKTLPEGWVWTNLGEIRVDRSKGIEPNKLSEQQFELYSVPSFDLRKPEIVYGVNIGSNKQTVEIGTVLLCKINPRINRVWVIGPYSDYPKIASTEWIPFFKIEEVIPAYLCYYLCLDTVRTYLAANASGVGGSLMRITPRTIVDFPFPLAPIPEQHRIVAAIEQQFSRLDAGVAALKRAKAKLKRYRAAVLKAAVEGKLTESWRAEHPTTEPASLLLERILKERRAKWEDDLSAKRKDPAKVKYVEPAAPDVESLSELPKGWCWIRAEQICGFITKGTTPTSEKLFSGNGEIPFIKVYNLTNSGILDFSVSPTFISQQTHSQELARSRVFPDDILMNIVGPPLGKVSLVPALYSEWNINQAIAIFRPMFSYNRAFLCFCLLTEQILSWAVSRAKATAGQFNLTLEICRDLPLPLPPLLEQEQIVAEVERHLSLINQLEVTVEANLKRSERLRQSILHEAFTGRLVPQDQTDEPASVLLERIRNERNGQKNGKGVNDKKSRSVRVPEPVTLDIVEAEQTELWESVGN